MPLRASQCVVLLVVGAGNVGCLGPRRDDCRSSQVITISDPSRQADRLWEAAKETLRRHELSLDRVDRRAGVITTMPEASQHFFEIWRHDVDTDVDFWEATLNPIRRWAEVRIDRGDEGTWQGIEVMVHKERLSSPDRQFNNSGAAYQFFGTTLPTTTGEVKSLPMRDVWLDLGRDASMEDYFLRLILSRAEQEDGAS